ncbi:hypothetical protein LINPERHAP2_LOCUS34375, partial [Linum perenne]
LTCVFYNALRSLLKLLSFLHIQRNYSPRQDAKTRNERSSPNIHDLPLTGILSNTFYELLNLVPPDVLVRVHLVGSEEISVANFPQSPPRWPHGESRHAKFMVIVSLDSEGKVAVREDLVVLLEDFFGYLWRRGDDCGYLAEFEGHQWAMNLGKFG